MALRVVGGCFSLQEPDLGSRKKLGFVNIFYQLAFAWHAVFVGSRRSFIETSYILSILITATSFLPLTGQLSGLASKWPAALSIGCVIC